MRSSYDCDLLHSLNTSESNLQEVIMLDLRQEIKNLKHELETTRTHKYQLERSNDILQHQCKKKNSEATRLMHELQSFKLKMSNLTDEMLRLNKENTDLTQKYADMMTSYEKETRKNATILKEIYKINFEKTTLQLESETRLKTIEELKEDLIQAKRVITSQRYRLNQAGLD